MSDDATPVDHDLSLTTARIEALIQELDASPDGETRRRTEELVRLSMALHGAGLARLLDIVRAHEAAGPMIEQFAADPAIATLLALHGLHPHDVSTRIAQALARVRAHLGSGVDATLLSVSGGVARVHVACAAGERGAPAGKVEAIITQAVENAAPEVSRVEIDGLRDAPALPLVQIARRSPERGCAPQPSRTTGETCERCGAAVDAGHRHIVDLESRRLLCSCRSCWLALREGVGQGHYRAVPDRCSSAPPLCLSEAQWEALQIPVDLAFFLVNSTIERALAFYPSPAGAVESLLPLDAWRDLAEANPWLRSVTPDVEAVLVRKTHRGPDAYRCAVVPIDACYELVGRLRLHWRGFGGGDAVRSEIESFFADLPAPLDMPVPVGGTR